MPYPNKARNFLIRGGVWVDFMVAVLPLPVNTIEKLSLFFPFSLWEPVGLLKETTTKYEGPIWLLLLFSCSVMSNSLWPHGLQHARLTCSSLSAGVCSNSCPLSWWCYPTISSTVTLCSCPQSFPASGSFPVSHLFASDGQSIGALASASVLPIIQVDFI